jgi:hypothetical protein
MFYSNHTLFWDKAETEHAPCNKKPPRGGLAWDVDETDGVFDFDGCPIFKVIGDDMTFTRLGQNPCVRTSLNRVFFHGTAPDTGSPAWVIQLWKRHRSDFPIFCGHNSSPLIY